MTDRQRKEPDYYAQRAKAESYVSRAVYKLEEIDRKYRLFQNGQRVLDLGCAPGSWLQYIAGRVGPRGLVVGVDQAEVKIPAGGTVHVIRGDITALGPEVITALTPAVDVLVSDLAPATCGIKDVDHQRSLDLARLSYEWASALVRPGGDYLVKIFEGPDMAAFVQEVKAAWERTDLIKPAGSRRESREIYLLGRGKRRAVEGARGRGPLPPPPDPQPQKG